MRRSLIELCRKSAALKKSVEVIDVERSFERLPFVLGLFVVGLHDLVSHPIPQVGRAVLGTVTVSLRDPKKACHVSDETQPNQDAG